MEEKTWRVKVYQLNEQDDWDDKGTGKVSCLEPAGQLSLRVISEKQPNLVLLEVKVNSQDFQNQQDTLIVWIDPKTELNLALSFQDPVGCKYIWERIRRYQKSVIGDDEILNSSLSLEDPASIIPIDLPTPNLNNLERILQIVNSIHGRSEELTLSLTKDDNTYLQKLFELCSMCEDLDDTKNLGILFNIFKQLVILNDATLLDTFFSDDIFSNLLGALEFDPEIGKRQKHREYINSVVVFKEVIPFESPELISKIHQTFRIQYLKDVVLPRHLDDPTFGTLNSWIGFNNVEIVRFIQSDEKFLNQVFSKIFNDNESQFKDLILFLQELCTLSKNLQVTNRVSFYQVLASHGLTRVIEKGITNPDRTIRLAIVNILDNFVCLDSELARQEIISEKPKYTLFNQILCALLNDTDSGIRVQLVDIIKILLDFGETTANKEEFLNLVYGDFLNKLIEPFGITHINNKDEEYATVKESVCDLLSFCVQNHGFRIKYFILGNNVVSKILTLLKCKEKHLVLAAIRFFRAVISARDDFYYKHIVKYNLFLPIVEIFKANKDKYNLLNSTILDIFEFILKENNKYLILHIVENYRDIFAPITYVETFKNLFLKYDQYTEPPNEELQDSTTSSATVSEKSIHESQDDYFKESGEEEEISTSFGSLTEEEDRQFKPLVIYKEEQEEKPILSPNSPEKKRLKRKISFNLKMNSVVPNSSSPNKEEEENIEPIPKRRRQTGPEEEEHSSNSENHTSSSGNKEQSNSKEKSNDTLTNQEEHENNKTNTTKQFNESEEAATTKQSKESEEAATPKQQTNKVNEIDSPILNGTSNRVVPTLIISPPSGLTETSKENQV